MNRNRAVLLAAVAVVALAALGQAARAAEFTDVPKYHWAWRYVRGVSDAQIANGYPGTTTYKPDVVVTRDQMGVYVARGLAGGDDHVPSGPAEATFSDVAPGTWDYDYVEYCADPARDVVRGFGGSSPVYGPDLPVTRESMAVYIARAVAGGDTHVPTGPATPTFTDVTGGWAYKYVEYCADPIRAIVLGYDDKGGKAYRPGDLVSRAQMAVYVCRAFSLAMPPQPYNVTDYFPLTQGRTWMFQSPTGFSSQVVPGTVDLSGQTYAVLTDYPEGSANYWLASDDGLRWGEMHDGTSSATTVMTPPLLIPNGLDPGATGTQTVSISINGVPSGQATFSYQFVGTEPVTVPAGTFADCMKLEMTMTTPQGSSHIYYWAAKGVGFVKWDSRPFGGIDHSELIGYTVPSTNYALPLNVTDHFPLDQGDTWNYLVPWGSMTETISGTTTLLGLVYSNRTDSDNYTENWRNATDGAHMGGFVEPGQGQIIISPAIAIPNGLIPGERRAGNAILYANGVSLGPGTMNLSFPGVDDVTVPAGTFTNCMKLELQLNGPGGGDHYYQWLAPGVGEVIRDETPLPGTHGDSYVLQSATIGGVHYP
jgi:hypothetical protein